MLRIHRVQHLNMRRAADAAAEWVNNDLRAPSTCARNSVQRDHLVLGDVGGDELAARESSGRSGPERHCWHLQQPLRVHQEVPRLISMSASPSFSSVRPARHWLKCSRERLRWLAGEVQQTQRLIAGAGAGNGALLNDSADSTADFGNHRSLNVIPEQLQATRERQSRRGQLRVLSTLVVVVANAV